MKVLFVIVSDPRTSHRPAEAIRIAAGVGTWQKAQVSVYLYGAAARVMNETEGDFVDEEHIARYLPMIEQPNVYVHKDAKEFARIASEHSVVTWF